VGIEVPDGVLSISVGRIIIDQDLGETFAAETGFLISRDPDTVLAPDFAYIAKERLPDPLSRSYVPVVTDIVLEARSPSDTSRGVAEKVERWIKAGVKLVWELNPADQTLTVYRPGVTPRVLGILDVLDGEEVLPGFSVSLSNLFPVPRN